MTYPGFNVEDPSLEFRYWKQNVWVDVEVEHNALNDSKLLCQVASAKLTKELGNKIFD